MGWNRTIQRNKIPGVGGLARVATGRAALRDRSQYLVLHYSGARHDFTSPQTDTCGIPALAADLLALTVAMIHRGWQVKT